MDRLRKIWLPSEEQAYEPLSTSEAEDGGGSSGSGEDNTARHDRGIKAARKADNVFSVEYSIFLLLGISMLWAWNMFLAAGPYFQHRFVSSHWISENFQAAEISVSTLTNLSSMLILTRLQVGANYPRRIIMSLVINMVVFALLSASTAIDASAEAYFVFLMLMTFCTSLATGFSQNGVFAYVSGFAEPNFTQGIMTGQAVAGVLPCIAQIVSVLSVQGGRDDHRPSPPHERPPGPPPVRWTAALMYFCTATAISVFTLLAFSILLARNRSPAHRPGDDTETPAGGRKSIPLLYLLRKLIWPAASGFVTFTVTMMFPVFTQRIVSVRPIDQQPPILQAPSFIPLALLFWNVGDLLGRLLTVVPALSLISKPRTLFSLAVLRVAWVGLYYLCNIRGHGAIVPSDFFYLVVVQLLFGLSNGFLGSTCMIGASEWVEEGEREAAGSFMGLCLIGGLTVGSLLSFCLTGV